MKPSVAKDLKPHVFEIDKKNKEIKVAYIDKLFELASVPQILSSIGGNIFGMKCLQALRLQDISLPESIVTSFKGPKFGIYGIRRMLNVQFRPLCGTIVKPKVGLNSKEHARVAYEAWLGGLDAVKDDENLTSQKFNRFEERIKETLKMKEKAEKETGENKVYFANVTAETREMLKRAEFVKESGGEYVMIDIITSGWSALQTLREADLGLAIHAHRAGHAMFTNNPRQGMSMLVVAKLARLIGVDNIHIGAIVGKMKSPELETKNIGEEIEDMFVSEQKKENILRQEWFNIKPTFPVCSGGLHPGLVPALMDVMGKDIIIQCGGGVHGHPKGTQAGATALRQAIDAVMKREDILEYAKTHKELKLAIEKWGAIPKG
jgi:ribulose-bisphosphate carboxylase large chain